MRPNRGRDALALPGTPSEVAPEDEEPEDDIRTAFTDRQLYQVLDIRGLARKLTGLVDFHPLVKPHVPAAFIRERRSPNSPQRSRDCSARAMELR